MLENEVCTKLVILVVNVTIETIPTKNKSNNFAEKGTITKIHLANSNGIYTFAIRILILKLA
jgi:hypothetical protein